MAVGADRAAVRRVALAVVGRGADLVLLPRVAAVVRHGDLQRRGAALPFSWPTNAAQQTYTLPKNGLDAALSAQICSLSENVVEDCFEMTTGAIQALLSPAAAACDVVGARDARSPRSP